MKARDGYVGYNESRKRYFARVTSTDPLTGKRKDIVRFAKTKTEALKIKTELLTTLNQEGVKAFCVSTTTFSALARKFEKEKLIPAVYVGEKKIAGRRELTAPTAWLKQLEYFFGRKKLSEITKGDIEKFRIWLSK